jgi:hypothetical protein
VVPLWGHRKLKDMILATHGFLASSIGQFDADAVAFFDRVTTAGGTLSNTEKLAVNQLVLDMKDDGIWTKMKAIYPMVGASAAACAQNLKSSSFTGTFTSGWTFASTGVKGTIFGTFMDTGLNSFTHLSQTSTSLSLYVRNNSSNGNPYDIGNATGGVIANATYLITRYSGNLAYIGVADSTYGTSIASTDSRGFWVGSTNGSLTQTLYKNGSSIKSGTAGASTMANNNLYLGAINNGTTGVNSSDKEFAFCAIGDGLSGTNASNFNTAVQAFQTTLSREV